MLFSSMFFMWIFLPITLIIYWISPKKAKNYILLIASLIFYAWGEPLYIFLMLFVVLVDFILAYQIEKKRSKLLLILSVCFNIGILGYFKYLNFFVFNINRILPEPLLSVKEIALPLGISFYIFQSLSYVIDVYRGDCKAQKNFSKLLLYISFFPQLIAGPIVKYHDIENQIENRICSIDKTAYGIRRFIFGLAKKVLLSNTLAYYADEIMDGSISNFSSGVLWFGALLYTLQIYYDFSGYSDMAIGLGQIFGFEFHENFNYPYISTSIREFWRRWHISLSTWFKEYVYIPLGGNRRGSIRTYQNLLIVFLLTGFWHGASFNFIFWGLFYGLFIVIERLFLGKLLEKNPIKILNHIYCMVIVIVGWVIFRQNSMSNVFHYLLGMFTFQKGNVTLSDVCGLKVLLVIIIGILLCGILQHAIPKLKTMLYDIHHIYTSEIFFEVVLLSLCIISLISNTYNPFIYFRF